MASQTGVEGLPPGFGIGLGVLFFGQALIGSLEVTQGLARHLAVLHGLTAVVAQGSVLAKRFQSGLVYSYALVMLIGVAAFATWFMVR